VFDTGSEPAIVFIVGMHFALEAAIPLAAKKAQNIFGGKRAHRMIQKRAVQVGQRHPTGEQQVGGELGLIDDPMHGAAGELFSQQRIDLPCPTIQDFRPVELGKAVGQALGLDRIVELSERVVLLHEAQFFLHHLLGKPFVAIDVDLDRKRQPGLQANVDQAELGIEKVIIKDPLLPRPTDELRTIGTKYECKGMTCFLGAEDADEPLGDTLIANDVLGPLVFAELASAILVYAACLPSPALSVLDQAV
jgi:hypothetical protein